jgi:hypothetical protein
MEAEILAVLAWRFRVAFIASMLWVMRRDILCPFSSLGGSGAGRECV